ADVGREVDLVDDEQVGAEDAGAALPRDLLALRHVDDVDGGVHQLRTEGGGEVVPAALHEDQLEVGEALAQDVDGLQVHGRILADGRVRTATGLDTQHALGGEHAAPDQHVRVLLRV